MKQRKKGEPTSLSRGYRSSLPFCFNLRSGVLLPFLFWRRKNEKKKTLIAGLLFLCCCFYCCFFFSLSIIERDFFPCSPDVISNPPSIENYMRKYVTKNSNQKAYALKLIPGVLEGKEKTRKKTSLNKARKQIYSVLEKTGQLRYSYGV